MFRLLRFALTLLEWAIQLKKRDEHEKKQERLREARTNPAGYLRQFGRVQPVKPDDGTDRTDNMRSSGTSTDKHKSK